MTDYPDFRFRKYVGTDGKPNWYEITEECQVAGQNIIVPARYVTDFASVPRWLWPLFSPYGLAANPSILHDYMYTSKALSAYYGDTVARYIADNLFYKNLINAGMPKIGAKCMYLGVRWFGKGHYGRESKLAKY